jgi:hypothetical protein
MLEVTDFSQINTRMDRNSWTTSVGIPFSNGMLIDGEIAAGFHQPKRIGRNVNTTQNFGTGDEMIPSYWRPVGQAVYYHSDMGPTPGFQQSYAPTITINNIIGGKDEKNETRDRGVEHQRYRTADVRDSHNGVSSPDDLPLRHEQLGNYQHDECLSRENSHRQEYCYGVQSTPSYHRTEQPLWFDHSTRSNRRNQSYGPIRYHPHQDVQTKSEMRNPRYAAAQQKPKMSVTWWIPLDEEQKFVAREEDPPFNSAPNESDPPDDGGNPATGAVETAQFGSELTDEPVVDAQEVLGDVDDPPEMGSPAEETVLHEEPQQPTADEPLEELEPSVPDGHEGGAVDGSHEDIPEYESGDTALDGMPLPKPIEPALPDDEEDLLPEASGINNTSDPDDPPPSAIEMSPENPPIETARATGAIPKKISKISKLGNFMKQKGNEAAEKIKSKVNEKAEKLKDEMKEAAKKQTDKAKAAIKDKANAAANKIKENIKKNTDKYLQKTIDKKEKAKLAAKKVKNLFKKKKK